MRLIFKKSFSNTTGVIMYYLLGALIICSLSVFIIIFPAQTGDFDYTSYITFPPLMSSFAVSAMLSLISDLYTANYIRTSRLYRTIRTRALPITALIYSAAAFLVTVTATAFTGCEALPDIIMSFSLINFCFVASSSIFKGTLALPVFLMFTVNLANTFDFRGLINGYGVDLPQALLSYAVLSLAGLLVAFFVSDILYKHRKRAKRGLQQTV